MIVEMIRFSLFGTPALRGETADYKTLECELSWDNYRVKRKINKATLYRDGDEIAVGVTPVNAKIREILGFGMEVFDVSCVAKQGDLQSLGKMRPLERKRMVDEVIGLGAIDEIAKWAADEATALRRRLDDLEADLQAPIPPTPPVRTATPQQLAAHQANQKELHQLQGWLSTTRTKPTEPVCLDASSFQLPILQAGVDELGKVEAEIKVLDAQIEAIPIPKYEFADLDRFEAELVAYDRWQERQRFLRLHSMPKLTVAELEEAMAHIEAWERLQQAQHIEKKIADLLAKGSHECPSCQHQWPVAADDIEALQAQLPEDLDRSLSPPTMTRGEVEKQARLLDDWLEHLEEWTEVHELVPEASRPTLTQAELNREREASRRGDERLALNQKLAEMRAWLTAQPDWRAKLRARQAYDVALLAYEREMKAFNEWAREAVAKAARAQALDALVREGEWIPQAVTECQIFERLQAKFEEEIVAYDAKVETIAAFKLEHDDWKKVRDAILRLRVLIKQHLLPSLNKVASSLMSQMTNGEKKTIHVDDDFEITVDGQKLHTLSGSGMSAANLALRLALGQVLTNGVMSLFIGDELDADMDKRRSEKLAFILQYMKRQISQILLVTHKYPVADYYISTGHLNDDVSGSYSPNAEDGEL